MGSSSKLSKEFSLIPLSWRNNPHLVPYGKFGIGRVDPHNTVHMLYNAIKGQGVETEYVKYPDEGHNFEKPKNRRDALERTIKWIDEYMGKAKKL